MTGQYIEGSHVNARCVPPITLSSPVNQDLCLSPDALTACTSSRTWTFPASITFTAGKKRAGAPADEVVIVSKRDYAHIFSPEKPGEAAA